MIATINTFSNPAAMLAIWMSVLASSGLLLWLVPGLFKNSIRESQLRRTRLDGLTYALSMLSEGMPCSREVLGEGRHAKIYTFYRDGVLIRHSIGPQDDQLSMTVDAEHRLKIDIRKGKIDDHLAVTDEEHLHARQVLALLREAEAKVS